MFKKFWGKIRKRIRKLLIGLVLLGFIYALNEWLFPLIFQKKILDYLLVIPLKYYNLLLVLINLGLIIYFFPRFKSLTSKKAGKVYTGFSKPKKRELENLIEKQKAILNHLVGKDNYYALSDELLEYYDIGFPDKSKRELNLNLKELQRLGLVRLEQGTSGTYVTITDKGCEILSNLEDS